MKVQRPVRKDVGVEHPEMVCINFYVLTDPRNGGIRYVGQTVNPENRFRNHIYEAKRDKRTHKDRWILSLLRKNLKPIMKILWSGFLSSDEANKVETKLISRLGKKYKLTNSQDRARNCTSIETKPVYQFDMQGCFIARYLNANKASIATGVHDSAISSVCSNPTGRGNRSRGGFLWSYTDKALVPEVDYRRTCCAKQVSQILDGIVIETYPSARIASESTGVCYKRISACINGRQKTAGGYVWKVNEDMV